MKNAYKIVINRWFNDKPLNLKEFSLGELEDAMSQGCKERNHAHYMHEIAKRVEELRSRSKNSPEA